MTLIELKENAAALIAKSNFEEAFKLLFGSLDAGRSLFQNLIQQSGRHSRTLQDDLGGVISRENANLEYNQIRQALLHLVNQLEEKDLGSGGSREDPLAIVAKDLPVDFPLTPLYLVNCDRRDPLRLFWSVFNDSVEQSRRFQFYFLPCCPSQQPEGFAERIVNELLENELDGEYGAMDYRRRPASGEERLLIEPLPLGNNLEGSKKKFKKYFADRFGLANSDLAFEEYLRTGLPALPWEYVVTAFKIIDEDWDDARLRPYLEWLMATFSATGPDIPNFLFFFIVTIKHAHREGHAAAAAQEAMAGVKALVAARGKDRQEGQAAAPGDATLIEPLPPVAATDLEKWMDRLGDVREDQKQGVIKILASRLKGDEASWYSDRKEFNMERIEDFQEKVYQAHKNK